MLKPNPHPYPYRHKFIKEYPPIARGTSVLIPLRVQFTDATPFDLENWTIFFTMKSVDHWGADDDFFDSRAFIAKEYTQENEVGEVSITLSSKDTYIPPGEYIFDVKAQNKAEAGATIEFGVFHTEILPNPTNRAVQYQEDYVGTIAQAHEIRYIIRESAPIVTVIPFNVPVSWTDLRGNITNNVQLKAALDAIDYRLAALEAVIF